MILEPVRIAVIGTEGYSWQLIKRLMSIPHVGVVVAVTSLDANSSSAQYCRQRDIAIYPDVDAMLLAGNFEVVINSTPIHLHARMTERCLAAGYPVWMEKPPVATVQEFDRLQRIVSTRKAAVSIGFNSLYSHLTQNLKTELLAGRFGKIHRVKGIGAWVRASNYYKRNNWAGRVRQDGEWILDGDLNNALSHILCNNLYFAASSRHALAKPIEVEAELYRCNEIESEDTSCVRILTQENIEILTYLTLSTNEEIPPTTLIETEKALITFEDFKRVRIEFRDGSVEEHEAYQEDRIEMFLHLCRAHRLNEDYLCRFNMMRPFIEAVNGAFDSAKSITTIPEQYLEKINGVDGLQVSIKGIDRVMKDALGANLLFSAMNVPWAVKSTKFNTSNYLSFPVRFQMNGTH